MLTDDPFAALSFIAGPALMTNASSLLLLGTINRYARALDRARLLAAQVAREEAAADETERVLLRRQLHGAQRRVRMVVRSLTAFYTAIGAFGIGTLSYLLGATVLSNIDTGGWSSHVMMGATTLGVICLIVGTASLVLESHLSYGILRDEERLVLRRGDRGIEI
jgi:hypothetical protein